MLSYRRDRLYLWLKHDVYKLGDGYILPKSLQFIKALIFPVEFIKYRIYAYGLFGYHFDWCSDSLMDRDGNRASLMSILNYIRNQMEEYSKRE